MSTYEDIREDAKRDAYYDKYGYVTCPECGSEMHIEDEGHGGSRYEPPEPTTYRCPKDGCEVEG